MSELIRFFQRPFPSANMVLLRGPRPLLVDSGFGSDVAETEALLRAAGTPPEALAGIVNTHYHGDHAGGNWALQTRYGTPVVAHRWEAALLDAHDAEACAARWLRQPVAWYRVDRTVGEGDWLDTGRVRVQLLHTPGHTLGHLSLWLPDERLLVVGDAFHGDDVAWLNVFREGVAALERALESVQRLARLPARVAYSGHGAPIHDLAAAAARVERRYTRWRTEPEAVGWHAVKRIFAYALMLHDGMAEARIAPWLLAAPWFVDFATHLFRVAPTELVAPLLAEMVRSGAAAWEGGTLRARTPYRPPPVGWPSGPLISEDW